MEKNIMELPNKEEWIQKQVRPYRRSKTNSLEDIKATRALVKKKRIEFGKLFDTMTSNFEESHYDDTEIVKRIKALEDKEDFDDSILAERILNLEKKPAYNDKPLSERVLAVEALPYDELVQRITEIGTTLGEINERLTALETPS